MRPLEALVFLSLAGAAHVALWSVAPQLAGASADGAAPAVTLAAATLRQAALAQAWQTAPEMAEAATPPPPPSAADPPPEPAPAAETHPTLAPAPGLAPILAPILPAAPPGIDAAPPRIAPPRPPAAMVPPARIAAPPKRPGAEAARPMPPAPTRVTARHDDTPAQADRMTPAPQPPSPQAAPPRAASAAATARSGRGGRDAAQSAQGTRSDRLRAQWGAQIQALVHRRLIYPRGASGSATARVALTIERSGRLSGLKLLRSSGTPAFDDAALNAVRRAGQFPAAPAELTRAGYGFTLSLTFRP